MRYGRQSVAEHSAFSDTLEIFGSPLALIETEFLSAKSAVS